MECADGVGSGVAGGVGGDLWAWRWGGSWGWDWDWGESTWSNGDGAVAVLRAVRRESGQRLAAFEGGVYCAAAVVVGRDGWTAGSGAEGRSDRGADCLVYLAHLVPAAGWRRGTGSGRAESQGVSVGGGVLLSVVWEVWAAVFDAGELSGAVCAAQGFAVAG